MRERCILLKIQCLCSGKITLQRNVHFFTGYIQETLCLKLTLHVLCSTPYGMNVTHTRISTLQGSSRGHYNGTLQLALFDKKRRKVITVFYCIISLPKSVRFRFSVELEGNLLLLCPYFVSVYSYSADFDCFTSNHQRIA